MYRSNTDLFISDTVSAINEQFPRLHNGYQVVASVDTENREKPWGQFLGDDFQRNHMQYIWV
nr:CBM_HP1_G0026650.mRNA.1.CDS.1 [Saccharomyces cerevisiae]